MSECSHKRRGSDVEGAYFLAIIYTIGYLSMMGILLFHEMPDGNREVFLFLGGIMSAAQLGIIKHYYDGSRAAEMSQRAGIAGRAQADAVLQDIAKTVPSVVAASPIKTENVAVEANTATLTEKEKP